MEEEDEDHLSLTRQKALKPERSDRTRFAVVTKFRDVVKHCFQLALIDPAKLEEIFQEQVVEAVILLPNSDHGDKRLLSGLLKSKNDQLKLTQKAKSHSLTEKSLKKENEELKAWLDGFIAEAG
ncbi:hypothetical protein GIB67_025896 [Kingdonia uniflora]|uniref:Uncharacterized protein n=1 Tax=Kingdonia uniflora TaxID=39325 RepID=A0A7J7NYW6_9MAGN|nr:hypothetical protein GIB67_025896 [Kingdonia uniflora]